MTTGKRDISDRPLEMTPELYRLILEMIDQRLKEVRVTRDDFKSLQTVVQELAQAQARTEKRVEELAQAVENLTQAQMSFERTFHTQIGALGARWGLYTEESFRQAIEAILRDVGFDVRRYVAYDDRGEVFGRPEQIELDVVIGDGKDMILEIKSSVSRADVAIFGRKVDFYRRREGKEVGRRAIVSPFVEERARQLASEMGIEVYTRPKDMAG